jgi:hypothetical protein
MDGNQPVTRLSGKAERSRCWRRRRFIHECERFCCTLTTRWTHSLSRRPSARKLVDQPFAALASSGFFSVGLNENQSSGPPIIGQIDFCDTDCTFADWGAFVLYASFKGSWRRAISIQRNELRPRRTRNERCRAGLGAAANIPSVGQLPFTGSARYSGDAFATVATNLFYTGQTNASSANSSNYVATGDLNMN